MPEDVSWSHFFSFEKTFFRVSVQNFCHCFTWKISRLFANRNPELRCVICTGVTLFALACYTWTALLSASQDRVIFSCVLLTIETSFQRRLTRRKIIKMRLPSFAFEKTPLISLSCMLVPVQYRDTKYGLDLWLSTVRTPCDINLLTWYDYDIMVTWPNIGTVNAQPLPF